MIACMPIGRRAFLLQLAAPALPAQSRRRLFYNYDPWAPFYQGHSEKAIRAAIAPLLGTQVTTLALSPNVGQSLNYPSRVGEMCHTHPISAQAKAEIYKGMGDTVARAADGVAEAWRLRKIDAFGLLVKTAVDAGLEVFASFRMNDMHMVLNEGGQGAYTDAFYRDHPDWRLPRRGLNYAIPEVRRYRLAVFEELLTRYPFQGLELDFLRGVPFFPKGTGKEHCALMSGFLGDVRAMMRRLNRKLVLTARVPSSLEGCRKAGLDPIAWQRGKLIDLLAVGQFLHLFYRLPIRDFQVPESGVPVYASLDFIVGGTWKGDAFSARDANAEMYRGAAAAAYAAGAAGIHLFNMFAPRANGPDADGKDWSHEEPFEVLSELRERSTLERKPKLYLVDTKVPRFDDPAIDVSPQLPRKTDAVLSLLLGERQPAGKRFVLRVKQSAHGPRTVLKVRVNGRPATQRAGTPPLSLCPEPYNQMRSDAEAPTDFDVPPGSVKYGDNEIAVSAAQPVEIRGVEMLVTL
jgi:hypothetical protein